MTTASKLFQNTYANIVTPMITVNITEFPVWFENSIAKSNCYESIDIRNDYYGSYIPFYSLIIYCV